MQTNGKKLADKVAIVTGASKGIGAGIAKQLAAEGAAEAYEHMMSGRARFRAVLTTEH